MTVPSGVSTLNRVWGSGPTNVFAVGDGGPILHYDGRTWEKMSSPVTATLFGLWGSGPADVFAVGDSCTVLHYDGTTWTSMATGITASPCSLLSVSGGGPTDVVAVGAGGARRLRVDYDGTSWQLWKPPTPEPSVGFSSLDVWQYGSHDLFVIELDVNVTVILHFDGKSETNSGYYSSYSPDPLPHARPRAVWGTGPTDVWAVGSGVIHYDGKQWTQVTDTLSFSGNAGWSSGPADVFVVSAQGMISHYDSQKWTVMASDTSETLHSIWGSAPDNIFAVGENATVVHYSCTR